MKKYSSILLLLLLLGFSEIAAQPNCEAFKYRGEMKKYEACKKAEERKGLYQFAREYQEILDEAIAIDPDFDYSYWAKSIAYLKSGDFLTWKKLIDKAVELDWKTHLGYRGWCRYQFFRDYKGAIRDIERLDSLADYDIGYSQNGRYHLNIAKGLCYKALGDKAKAKSIIKAQIKLNEEQNFIGTYDYLHLGVLYLELGEFEQALEVFEKQSNQTPLADNQFYIALTYQKLDAPEKALIHLEKAKELYFSERRLFDPYSNPLDKIYMDDIETELTKVNQQLAQKNDG